MDLTSKLVKLYFYQSFRKENVFVEAKFLWKSLAILQLLTQLL